MVRVLKQQDPMPAPLTQLGNLRPCGGTLLPRREGKAAGPTRQQRPDLALSGGFDQASVWMPMSHFAF